MKRLWEAYEKLEFIGSELGAGALDVELDKKVNRLIGELSDFMNDDFSTAKVMANLFELVPVINGIKDKVIPVASISAETLDLMKISFRVWIEDILGLKGISDADNQLLQGVMDLLVEIRKEAKGKKDFATSDKIRNQLSQLGILLKDEKDGGMSWGLA